MNRPFALLFVVTQFVVCFLACLQDSMSQVPVRKEPRAFASPLEAFSSYREACMKGDTGKELASLTSDFRDEMIFQTFLASQKKCENPKIGAILRRFGVDKDTVDAEFFSRYLVRHKVDLRKEAADYGRKLAIANAQYYDKLGIREPDAHPIPESVLQKLGPPPENKEPDLPMIIVRERLAGKVEFAVEARQALRRPDDDPVVIGEFKLLQSTDNTAIGEATTRSYIFSQKKGQPLTKSWQDTNVSFHFRKIDGSWLISTVD